MFLQECLCWTEAQSDFRSWSVTREPWTWSWQVDLCPARKRSSWDSPIDSSKLDRVTNMLTSNSYPGHLITWSDITCFSAIGVALNLALSLCRFPQECLNRDRQAAYYSCYDARSYDDAFKFEWENALHVVQQESVQGLSRALYRNCSNMYMYFRSP